MMLRKQVKDKAGQDLWDKYVNEKRSFRGDGKKEIRFRGGGKGLSLISSFHSFKILSF